MNRKKKIIFISAVAVLILIAGISGIILNRSAVDPNQKSFTLVIQSDRDNLSKTLPCTSDLATLGKYLRALPDCSAEDSAYGLYVTGWYGCLQDLNAQYWWCVSVDHADSANGVDQIPLENGKEYEFTLKQGW